MASIIFGSARKDENGKYSGGKAGDQTGHEVETQDFYVHSKGWYVLRPKKNGDKLGKAMLTACNNSNIGYSQSDRDGIIGKGTSTATKVNCDCSSLVRACIIDALGKDVGDFYTGDEADTLEASGLFNKRVAYKDGYTLKTGDVLVTKTKGHTGIIVDDGTGSSSRPVIKKGYKDSANGGTYCAEMQRGLNELGIKDANGNALEVDGSCGSKSDYAIRQYQTKYGLEVDGHFGPKSWAKLDQLLEASSVSSIVRINTALNCRSGPGTNYPVKAVLGEGSLYSCDSETNGWIHLVAVDGYVMKKYTTII